MGKEYPYSIDQWEKDDKNNQFCYKHQNWFYSGCNLECPRCHSLGFYGPKKSVGSNGEIDRKYRACKFCGFWQDVWGYVFNDRGDKHYYCAQVYCSKCGGLLDWTVPWVKELGNCEKCGNPLQRAKCAIDDPNHIYHKFKEFMDKLHSKS